jgi:3-methyladenine DNA glycosylase/8-oxoguanine DNA glycosylase
MLLIFNLRQRDVLPVDDLGVRKGFQYAYAKRKQPEPEQRWRARLMRAAAMFKTVNNQRITVNNCALQISDGES